MTLTIKITNDETGTNTNANYDYAVFVGNAILLRGRIEGHDRFDGWEMLVELLLEDIYINPYRMSNKRWERMKNKKEIDDFNNSQDMGGG